MAPLLAAALLLVSGAAQSTPNTPAPVEAALTKVRALKLAQTPQWRALGHYRSRWLWGQKSEVDGLSFFLAEDGRTDPSAELEATVWAFFLPAPPALTGEVEPVRDPKAHPQCLFPARYRWLAEQLGEIAPPPVVCPHFERWRALLKVKGLSLVYADGWMSSPASMYGHTFLRLDRGQKPGAVHLLDYVLNFGANTNVTNGIAYAILGVFGGFEGRFSTAPYYLKHQEYNNVEDRDLWIYRLNVTDAQVDLLVRHAWEMGGTYFDYFFFDENCSYQLLALLDVMWPQTPTLDRFWATAIPVDTLREVVERPNILQDRRRQPSHLSKLLAMRDVLSDAELDAVEAVAAGDLSAAVRASKGEPARSPERQARILETARALTRYRKGYVRDEDKAFKAKQLKLLLARARLRLRLPPIDPPKKSPPESGHETARLAVEGGISQRGPLARLTVRPSIHGLLDDEAGYLPNTALTMGEVTLRLDLDDAGAYEAAYIERAQLLEITSLAPLQRWYNRPSWQVKFGMDQATDLGCAGWSCNHAALRVGVGAALEAKVVGLTPLYALASIDVRAFGPFEDYVLLGAGGIMGARLRLSSWWRILLEGEVFYDAVGAERGPRFAASFKQAFSLGRRLGLRMGGQWQPGAYEATGMFTWYY